MRNSPKIYNNSNYIKIFNSKTAILRIINSPNKISMMIYNSKKIIYKIYNNNISNSNNTIFLIENRIEISYYHFRDD